MTKRVKEEWQQSKFNGATKAYDGYLVTFLNVETKEERTRHFQGLPPVKGKFVAVSTKILVVEAIAYADKHGLKIQSISCPETIWRDLKGHRLVNQVPEMILLGRQGRLDLLIKRPQFVKPFYISHGRKRKMQGPAASELI